MIFAMIPNAAESFDFKGVYIGQPATPEMIQRHLGARCGEGSGASTAVCNGRVTIAHVPADMNLVIGQSGNVQRISLRFESRQFGQVARAMIQKFGEPDSVQTTPVQNSFGARLNREVAEWRKDSVAVALRSIAGSRADTSSVYYYSQEEVEFLNRVRPDPAGDL